MNLSAHLSRHQSGHPSRSWPGRLLALCAILLLSACTLPPARAQSDEWQLGRIDDSSGTVWLDRDGDGSRHGVWRQQRLLDGDVVSTGGGGRAEISISRHRLRLDEHTRLRLLRLDDGRIEIELRHGSIGLGVYPASQAGSILISTAAGVIQPLDDGLLRVDADVDQRWFVTTWRQEVLIRQGRDQMQLGRHRRAELYRDNGGWRTTSLQPDGFSVWIRPLEEDRPPVVIQEPPAYVPAPIVRPAPIYNPPPVIIVPAQPPRYDHDRRDDRHDDWRRQPQPPAPARPPEGWMRPPQQPPVVIPPSRPPVLEVHPGLRQPERPAERPSERPIEPPRQDRIISTMPTQPPAVVPTAPVTPPPMFRQPAQPAPQPAPQPANPPAFRPAPAASSPSGERRHPLPMRGQREEVR